MTAVPPDPDPVDTPGVSTGSVEPGETPPDSGSTTASANQNPPPRRATSPMAVIAMIGLGVLAVLFLVVAVVYGLQVAGVLDRW